MPRWKYFYWIQTISWKRFILFGLLYLNRMIFLPMLSNRIEVFNNLPSLSPVRFIKFRDVPWLFCEPMSLFSSCIYIYIYIYSKVKLATVVEGDQKAPFSIATTPICSGGRYSFPWKAPLYPWYVPYIAEC